MESKEIWQAGSILKFQPHSLALSIKMETDGGTLTDLVPGSAP